MKLLKKVMLIALAALFCTFLPSCGKKSAVAGSAVGRIWNDMIYGGDVVTVTADFGYVWSKTYKGDAEEVTQTINCLKELEKCVVKEVENASEKSHSKLIGTLYLLDGEVGVAYPFSLASSEAFFLPIESHLITIDLYDGFAAITVVAPKAEKDGNQVTEEHSADVTESYFLLDESAKEIVEKLSEIAEGN